MTLETAKTTSRVLAQAKVRAEVKEARLSAVDLAALLYEAQFVSPGSDPTVREAMRGLTYRLAGELFPHGRNPNEEATRAVELRRARFIRLAGFRLPAGFEKYEGMCYTPSGPGDVRRTARKEFGGEL